MHITSRLISSVQFAKTDVCPDCKGARLNKEALHFRIHDKNIYELATMDISELYDWVCLALVVRNHLPQIRHFFGA